jgi:hypothetical protein
MEVCLLLVMNVVRYRSLRLADHSSRGVLSSWCVWDLETSTLRRAWPTGAVEPYKVETQHSVKNYFPFAVFNITVDLFFLGYAPASPGEGIPTFRCKVISFSWNTWMSKNDQKTISKCYGKVRTLPPNGRAPLPCHPASYPLHVCGNTQTDIQYACC